MSVHLLDVNVLIALMWPSHEAHARVHRWLSKHGRQGWATCPVTQAGFVRIVSNPAFSPDAVSPPAAVAILAANLRHEHHRFWKDECGFGDAVKAFLPQLVGHRQVTDAYLLGLAVRKRGCLATLDRGVRTLVRAGSSSDVIHIIR